ncbi:hypothetical protein pb186bvf_011785 [Paramecium bursaria]
MQNKTPSLTRETRPQTAVTQSKSLQMHITVPNDETFQETTATKFHNPTSLTPRSLKKLQEKRSNVKSEEHYSNLRLTKDQAEIEAPDNYFVKEIQIDKDDYDQFKMNFHKIVFDNFGNYLYTRPDPQGEEQKQQVFSALSNKNNVTSANLKRKLMLKTQSFQPRRIVDNLVKSSQEISSMNPRRRNILDVKQKAESTLNKMIQNMAKEKVLTESKSQLHIISQEMLNEVDKFIRENQVLHDQLEIAKNQILELQSANESLNFKNLTMQKELKAAKLQLDQIKRGTVDLEKFIPQYKIISQKFPELSAEKLIDRYEYFENASLNLTKKVADLEEDKRLMEKQNVQIRKDYEIRLADMGQYKGNSPVLDTNIELEQELKEALSYRDQYMLLFNKILQIYCDWSSKTKAFLPDKIDSGPRSKLVDPLEMLQNMEEMIKISSNEKLQGYLRKIIVSANLLQRKYLPENVNLKFAPDKIYDRLVKLLDSMNAQLQNLQHQNKILLQKQKVEDDKTESKSYIE